MTYAQDRLAQLKAENKAREREIKARIRNIAVQAVKRVGHPKGKDCHAAKLTEEQVRSIRSMASAGFRVGEIRRELMLEDVVTLATLCNVIARRSWTHI